MLAPLKSYRWYTTNVCVHQAQGYKISEAKALHRAVWHSRPHEHPTFPTSTQGLIHTLGHTARSAWQPGSPAPSLPTASVQEGSRLPGPFQIYRHRKLRQPSSQKKKKKASLYSPFDPPSACFELNKLFLRCPLRGRFSSAVQGGRSLSEVRSPGWLSPSAWRVWLVLWGVESGSSDSPGRLVWEPGTLRRQTRAELCARRAEASRGARDASAQEQPVLARPVPPPPTWTWKCRLTVRMGGGCLKASRDGIYRLTLPGVTEEEPINDKTWVTNQQQEFDEGRPSTRIWGVLRGVLLTHPAASLPHPSAHPKHH